MHFSLLFFAYTSVYSPMIYQSSLPNNLWEQSGVDINHIFGLISYNYTSIFYVI